MGTRSLTFVYGDDETKPYVCMYRQYDGYPTGHGQELAEFLKHISITNGIAADPKNTANGAGCLAAQIVAHFKNKFGVGGIYLCPPDPSAYHGQDYTYTVKVQNQETLGVPKPKSDAVTLAVFDGNKCLFKGLPTEYFFWTRQYVEE